MNFAGRVRLRLGALAVAAGRSTPVTKTRRQFNFQHANKNKLTGFELHRRLTRPTARTFTLGRRAIRVGPGRRGSSALPAAAAAAGGSFITGSQERSVVNLYAKTRRHTNCPYKH